MSIPITCDCTWFPGPDDWSHVRRVYRDYASIGRVRRWRQEEPGGLTGEWFTAERKAGGFYEPIEGTHLTFEEALERVVMCEVAH